jgi:hypothetical protein
MDTNDTIKPETQSEPRQARCAVPICSAVWLRMHADVREIIINSVGAIDDECEREERAEIEKLRDAAKEIDALRVLLAFCDGCLSVVEGGSFNAEGVIESRRRIAAALKESANNDIAAFDKKWGTTFIEDTSSPNSD